MILTPDLRPGGPPSGLADTSPILDVSQLAAYLDDLLDGDPLLGSVWLRGEVSSLSRPASGHYYFCLKDDFSQLKTVLFRGSALRSAVLPESGMAVVAHGRVRFYGKQGTCELVADLLFPEGIGLAQMHFESLYRRLEAEGLFDTARKRPLPPFPRRIGLVTSGTGAALQDLLAVIGRRYPLADVVLVPAQVQGDAAPASITAALRALNGWLASEDGRGVDVVVVARGGGSSEDLAAFNDEGVARAIFASRAPVVSAVGHETDVTLADLVADLRAPTPSAAAELITPDLALVAQEVGALRARAHHITAATLVQARERCAAARTDLAAATGRGLRETRHQVLAARLRLGSLSPRATLGRGYAIAERTDGRVVRSAAELTVGETLRVRLGDGLADTTVAAVRPATA